MAGIPEDDGTEEYRTWKETYDRLMEHQREQAEFMKSHKVRGKCLRCKERKYLRCGLTGEYCVDQMGACRPVRDGRYLVEALATV